MFRTPGPDAGGLGAGAAVAGGPRGCRRGSSRGPVPSDRSARRRPHVGRSRDDRRLACHRCPRGYGGQDRAGERRCVRLQVRSPAPRPRFRGRPSRLACRRQFRPAPRSRGPGVFPCSGRRASRAGPLEREHPSGRRLLTQGRPREPAAIPARRLAGIRTGIRPGIRPGIRSDDVPDECLARTNRRAAATDAATPRRTPGCRGAGSCRSSSRCCLR